MCGSDTVATEVSRTSMNVTGITEIAISQTLLLGRQEFSSVPGCASPRVAILPAYRLSLSL